VNIVTASGRAKALPANLDPERVVGLDADGRIVVDDFGALNSPAPTPEHNPFADAPFLFGHTLCCNASDKGVEDGVVCRGCYDTVDVGSYLYREADGTFPGLDPISHLDTAVSL
jgi:hypothetical protein